jgi:carboxylesterase type B
MRLLNAFPLWRKAYSCSCSHTLDSMDQPRFTTQEQKQQQQQWSKMKPVSLLLAILPPAQVQAQLGATPTVTIAYPTATIIGESSSAGVDVFHGIPFAQPPTGTLRLKPPQPLETPLGVVTATGIPRACPQFIIDVNPSNFPADILGDILDNPLVQNVTDEGEDCLTLNVIRPTGTDASSNLPVLFWIFGGAFELGSTQTYDGTSLVQSSVQMGQPILFVAVNYRVGGFGFLAGKEILADGSTNLGLRDQRLGLQWTADNIRAFGGDPTKVTIWGESAGSISVLDQMVLYDGNNTYKGQPLFRGAIMDSGSIVPANAVDSAAAQDVYDTVVAAAGCSSASDTLECLRGVDYETLLNATNSVPAFLSYTCAALSYLPRPDSTTLTDSPDVLIQEGKYAPVPFIIGDQEDEGTLFSLFQSNITTTQDIVDYFATTTWKNANRSTIQGLVDTYPDDPAAGSPFRTGDLNNWYPQYKRLAAIMGDAIFTLSRRVFLSMASSVNPDVPAWSYLSSYDYGTPIMGTFHASDILQVFYGIDPDYASAAIRSYYFSFVYDLNPNEGGGVYMEWPQWNDSAPQLMNFFADSAALLADDFRSESYDYLVANAAAFRV